MSSINTIMRTSAMIFAEEQTPGSGKAVRRHFVEAILANESNQPQRLEDILIKVQSNYELTFLETEILPILNDSSYFVKVLGKKQSEDTYYLPENRYRSLLMRADYSLENAIEQYLSLSDTCSSIDDLRELLHRFLYHILNTNILAFNQLLEKKQQNVSSVVDKDAFEDDEIDKINEFLKWDDNNKDRALFELVNYCIEYAAAFNSINPSDIVSALRNKQLYLDNALLYRLLGINGEFRRQRARSLLDRCVKSGQHIYISSVTRKEFFDTIDYHLNQLSSTTPYGSINPSIFKKFSDAGSFYYYYHEWRHGKLSYGYTSFKQHIKNEYESLCREYNITEDFKQPYDEIDEASTIEAYAEGIQQHKWGKNKNLHVNDAKNVLWIEKAREDNDHSIRDTKYYFVTTDKRLQDWDLTHSKNQPVTMLPSQWLALLLKFFSQSGNDYKSFVSFLTISKDTVNVSPEELQFMLAGISEITEEFKTQEDIISSLLEDESNKDIRSRDEIKRFSKDKIEESYNRLLNEQKLRAQSEMDNLCAANEQQKKELQESFNSVLATMKSEFAKQEEQRRLDKLHDKLSTLNKQHIDACDKKSLIDGKADDFKSELGRGAVVIIVLYVAMIVYLIFRLGWDTMEPITFIVSLTAAAIVEIYSFIKFKSLNPIAIINGFREKRYDSLCKKYNFSQEEISDYEQDINNIRSQIESFEISRDPE